MGVMHLRAKAPDWHKALTGKVVGLTQTAYTNDISRSCRRRDQP
jgi:hypothetical protein